MKELYDPLLTFDNIPVASEILKDKDTNNSLSWICLFLRKLANMHVLFLNLTSFQGSK